MTYEEAIITLKTESCTDCTWGCDSPIDCKSQNCELKTATIIAITATEKQIHKKPVDCHHCPTCDVGIPIPPMASKEFKPFAKFPKYCDECGQALDWSEYDELEK